MRISMLDTQDHGLRDRARVSPLTWRIFVELTPRNCTFSLNLTLTAWFTFAVIFTWILVIIILSSKLATLNLFHKNYLWVIGFYTKISWPYCIILGWKLYVHAWTKIKIAYCSANWASPVTKDDQDFVWFTLNKPQYFLSVQLK